jgi:CDP-diacylglycerol---serine O-phosphatidyltransferase
MSIKKTIPNLLTIMNLLSGSLAIVLIFNDQLGIAGLLVLLASVFDFLDGFTARLLNAYSSVGKELDSLADLVSFGLVPAFIMFKMAETAITTEHWLLPFLTFSIIAFSALRLAIFNVDDTQSDQFVGLPTPANAIFFASFPILLQFGNIENRLHSFFSLLTGNVYAIIIVSLIFSLLLVSKFPLLSLKFKNLSVAKNKARFIFIFISLLLFMSLGIYSLPFIILMYIVISISMLRTSS